MPVAAHRATLEDVARAAGVHRSTASLSLRDHPRIPAATRDRVKAAAAALGYRIDPLISALMQTRRSPRTAGRHRLAFITRAPARNRESTAAKRFGGAASRARDFGFELEPVACDALDVDGRALSDRLSIRCINGVIVDEFPAAAPVPEFDWNRFSCVAIGRSPRAPALHRVVENDFEAAAQAMARCHQYGYRRVGLVLAARLEAPRTADHSLGAYASQHFRLDPDARLLCCPGQPPTAESFAAWFSLCRPDALLVDDPASVRGWLARLRLRAPRDVGLVGLRSHEPAECSGFYCDPARIGALATEMLLGLMHRRETGIPAVPHEILPGGEWRDHGTLCFSAQSASPGRRARTATRPPVDNARVAVP